MDCSHVCYDFFLPVSAVISTIAWWIFTMNFLIAFSFAPTKIIEFIVRLFFAFFVFDYASIIVAATVSCKCIKNWFQLHSICNCLKLVFFFCTDRQTLFDSPVLSSTSDTFGALQTLQFFLRCQLTFAHRPQIQSSALIITEKYSICYSTHF